jgi:hypothetical protein
MTLSEGTAYNKNNHLVNSKRIIINSANWSALVPPYCISFMAESEGVAFTHTYKNTYIHTLAHTLTQDSSLCRFSPLDLRQGRMGKTRSSYLFESNHMEDLE